MVQKSVRLLFWELHVAHTWKTPLTFLGNYLSDRKSRVEHFHVHYGYKVDFTL